MNHPSTKFRIVSLAGEGMRQVKVDRNVIVGNISWAGDGGSWIVVGQESGGQWSLLRVDPKGHATSMIPIQDWMYSAAMSPDGRRVVYTSNTVDSNIWMLEDF